MRLVSLEEAFNLFSSSSFFMPVLTELCFTAGFKALQYQWKDSEAKVWPELISEDWDTSNESLQLGLN